MEKLRFLFLPAIFLVLIFVCEISFAEMYERDLSSRKLNYDLFHRRHYNSLIRPVTNTSDSLMVNFTLALSAIINVDEKNQVIVTNVWLQMWWHDYQLKWDPKDYGNIETFRISHKRIWVPDMVLFNNADGKFEPSYNPNCVVNYTGDVKFIPPAIYTSSCTIDVEYFPFDQQVCEMKFGSWTFEGKTLQYNFQWGVKTMDLSDYNKNGAWDIIACEGNITTIPDVITKQPKQIIKYELVLRRKTLFYTVNLIIPCFLHAFVCLCVFVLPADGCEKMTLVISVLVSLVVFLLVVQKILPPSMKIPLIAKYFLFTFIMNVLEILVNVIIIYNNHKSPFNNVMPSWVCWMFLYLLPKILLMKRPKHEDRWKEKSCTAPPSYPATPQISRVNLTNLLIDEAKKKKEREALLPSASTSRGVTEDRATLLRRNFGSSKDQRSSAFTNTQSYSSGASSSRQSHDETSPLKEVNTSNFHLPSSGHRCMLRNYQQTPGVIPSDNQSTELVESNIDDVNVQRPVITQDILKAANAIRYIKQQMENRSDFEEILDDWKYVAAVLDRLLMTIFVLVSLGGTLGVLINAPHILETVDQDKIIEAILKG